MITRLALIAALAVSACADPRIDVVLGDTIAELYARSAGLDLAVLERDHLWGFDAADVTLTLPGGRAFRVDDVDVSVMTIADRVVRVVVRLKPETESPDVWKGMFAFARQLMQTLGFEPRLESPAASHVTPARDYEEGVFELGGDGPRRPYARVTAWSRGLVLDFNVDADDLNAWGALPGAFKIRDPATE